MNTTVKYQNGKGTYHIVPLLVNIIYPILVAMDILTTYIASPNLNYEINPIIVYFKLNWIHIIILTTFFVRLIMTVIITNNTFLLNYITNKEKKYCTTKLIVVLTMYIFFFSHFVATLFIIPNNIIASIYLHNIDNDFFAKIAVKHIQNAQILLRPINYFFLNSFFLLCGVFLFLLRIYFLKKKLTHYSSQNSP